MSTLTEIQALQATRRDTLRDAEKICLEARSQGREHLTGGENLRFSELTELALSLEKRIHLAQADYDRGAASPGLNNLSRRVAANNPPTKSGMSMARTEVFEQRTYQKGDPRRSYLRDIVAVSTNNDTTGEARDRLQRHAHDVDTGREYAEVRNLSRTEGSGGYAVPPAWLMDQYIELARPGRAFANLCQRQQLPGGTDSINIPKILTGTAVAAQVGDNTPVTETLLTDTFVRADVVTIAGQQGVALQLLDQSPIAFDDVIFRDLTAAYAGQLDGQVIGADGTGGTVRGVTNTPGIITISASATSVQGVYSAVADAIQRIHTQRFAPPEVIVMHPRRWGWFLSLLDNDDRPVFVPTANQPMNATGILTDVDSQQVVGQMHGLPVVTDPNVPPGAGTGNDEIFVMRSSDLVLYESGLRTRVLPETRATTLTVLLQLYGYVAFTAARYPQSVAVITNLTPPMFP